MASMNQEQMVTELSSWTVMEVAGLIKALEEKWGVSAAPVAVAGAAGPAPAAAVVEEKTEFDVELTSAGDKKINVIKMRLRASRRSSRKPAPRSLSSSALSVSRWSTLHRIGTHETHQAVTKVAARGRFPLRPAARS
jgi:hypothetical protein